MTTPLVPLNNGIQIPQLGFGTFQIAPDVTADAVVDALAAGYRHIDTAEGYGNELQVAEGIDRSGIDPDEVFVTSKVSNKHLTYEDAVPAIDESIRKLGRTPDLYLVHWPLAMLRDYVAVWRALEEAYADGKVKAIGVSNFTVEHLERLADESTVVPAVNQIEAHPYLAQEQLRTYHDDHAIVTEAWSPIAQGLVLNDPTIGSIAETVDRSPAQVVLRWHLQIGNVVFPKSTTAARVRENFALFDFELTADQVAAIDSLNRDQRTGADPETFRYKF